jgi:hypothetical protein
MSAMRRIEGAAEKANAFHRPAMPADGALGKSEGMSLDIYLANEKI